MPIRKNASGTYTARVNYTNANGQYKTKSKNASSLREAREKEKELLLQISSLQQNVDTNSITFEKMLDEFYVYKKSEIKITSYEKMRRINELHILPFFKGMKLNRINTRTIEKWKRSILEKDLALPSMQKIYANLSVIWKYAMKYYDIPTNYVQIAGNFRNPNEEEREYIVWTVDEFEKVDAIMKKMCEQDHSHDRIRKFGMRLAINIMFWCGLRLGESHALRWKDYVEQDSVAYFNIKNSISNKVKGVNYFESTTKTKASKGIVAIPEQVKVLIQEQYAMCQNIYKFNNDFFITGSYEPCKDSSLTNFKNQAEKTAKVPHIRIHDLRHSQASLLINAGVPIELVKDRLRHSSSQITSRTYAHIYNQSKFAVADILTNMKK